MGKEEEKRSRAFGGSKSMRARVWARDAPGGLVDPEYREMGWRCIEGVGRRLLIKGGGDCIRGGLMCCCMAEVGMTCARESGRIAGLVWSRGEDDREGDRIPRSIIGS